MFYAEKMSYGYIEQTCPKVDELMKDKWVAQ